MTKQYRFHLRLTSAQYLPYYRGQVQAIVVTTFDGVRVQFPAMHLRNYVTASGIEGNFCLTTKNNKFFSLTKLS